MAKLHKMTTEQGYSTDNVVDFREYGFVNNNYKGSNIVGDVTTSSSPRVSSAAWEERMRSGRHGNFPVEQTMTDMFGHRRPGGTSRSEAKYHEMINKYLPKVALVGESRAFVTQAGAREGLSASAQEFEVRRFARVDLIVDCTKVPDRENSSKMTRRGGVCIRVACGCCGRKWYIRQDKCLRDRENPTKILTVNPEEIDAAMLWRAKEWVGDWPGSDERRDRGVDFRSEWLQHMKEDTHALAKGHVQHLPTAMGHETT